MKDRGNSCSSFSQASALGPGGMNPLLQALGDKPSSTGPSTDLDAIQQRAGGQYGGGYNEGANRIENLRGEWGQPTLWRWP
jgi:hypothetical protein